MALVRRVPVSKSREGSSSFSDNEGTKNYASSFTTTSSHQKKYMVGFALPLFMLCGIFCVSFAIYENNAQTTTQTHRHLLAEGIYFTLDMKEVVNNNNNNNNSEKKSSSTSSSAQGAQVVDLGPHRAMVSITLPKCPYPRVYMRLVGDALVYIPLKQEENNRNTWSATFSMPMEGTYQVESRWYGCLGNETKWTKQSRKALQGLRFTAKGTPDDTTTMPNTADTASFSSTTTSDEDSSTLTTTTTTPTTNYWETLFPKGLWLSRSKFDATHSIVANHLWVDEDWKDRAASVELFDANFRLDSERNPSLVSTVTQSQGKPRAFTDLSNYELVCWVGNSTAWSMREAFLSLKDPRFPNQRKFKFHFYSTWSFRRPDVEWDRARFRKCKILLITMDELLLVDPPILTQEDYRTQVLHFLQQLVQAFPDETFPIWMLTVNEPPMNAAKSGMCASSSSTTARSSIHPCNDVLFDIFGNAEKNNLPPRVRLMDNTPIVHPQFDQNRQDIVAAIAMRIYIIVANQVSSWRKANQKGIKEGLMRNGTLEPNEDLVPFNFTEPGDGKDDEEEEEEAAKGGEDGGNNEGEGEVATTRALRG